MKTKKKKNNFKNNIYVLSNFTFNMIGDYINENLKKYDIINKIHYENFDQIDQALINYKKNKKLNQCDYVIIAYDLNMYLEKEFSIFPNKKKMISMMKRIRVWVKIVSELMNKKLIIFNFLDNKFDKFKITKDSLNLDISNYLNYHLNLVKNNNIIIYDHNSLANYYGSKNIYSDQNNYLAKIPYVDEFQQEISKNLSKIIFSEFFPRKKCLILDLDNTLWGGVLGEDGLKGVNLNNSYKGIFFQKFQKYIKHLKNCGIILAICSKNNLSDVKEMFLKHDGMILGLDDFSSIKCNWKQKSKNINEISKELNIGLNSMVFFDDSDLEREEVKTFCPEVHVLNNINSSKPEDYVNILNNQNLFHQNFITKEDRDKTKKYEILGMAQKEKQNFSDVNHFLRNLKMKAKIHKLSEHNFIRFVQMTNKINQFNITTRRYNEAKLKKFKNNKNNVSLLMNLKDKFGDHGLTALTMCELKIFKNKKAWFIENFLMSCRIISRTAEKTLLIELIKRLDKSKSDILVGKFIKTKKNEPCKNFFKENNFKFKDNLWILELNKFRSINNNIKVLNEK
jgi:FkbH-like protein